MVFVDFFFVSVKSKDSSAPAPQVMQKSRNACADLFRAVDGEHGSGDERQLSNTSSVGEGLRDGTLCGAGAGRGSCAGACVGDVEVCCTGAWGMYSGPGTP